MAGALGGLVVGTQRGDRFVSKWLTRPLAVLLPLALVLVSIGSFFAAERLVADQNRKLLNERAATIESLLGSTLQSTIASLQVLGQIAGTTPESASLPVFTHVAQAQLPASTAVGFAEERGNSWVWLAGAGGSAVGKPVAAPVAATLSKARTTKTLVATFLPGLPPTIQIALAVGRGVVYQEYPLVPAASGSSSGASSPFSGVSMALFSPADDSQPVFATARTPFEGEHAARPFRVGTDTWRIEVAASEPLVGPLTQQVPWLLLGGGLTVALLLGIALTTVTRRREYAERLVAERTAELERARVLRETLLRLGPVIVARSSVPDGELTYVSPNVRTILGIDDDVLADPVRRDALLHPDDLPRLAAASALVAAGDSEQESLELRLRITPDDVRWIHQDVVPERDPQTGEVVGVLAYVLDITERRRAEEELRTAHEAAEAANHAKSAFLSRMSHELRTPMNAVLGFAQLLESDELSPDQQESVRYILTAGRHLLGLIDEVLDISRIESGTMTLSPEPVLVADLVRESLDLVRGDAQARDIRLEQVVAPGAPAFARADQQRLKQVLLNLLSNAVKYNLHGGSVTVSVVTSAPDRILVSVADTGPGIAPERMPELFQPFHRLGAENSAVEGTGIGLALSRQLAEAMGATLGVDSTPGKGSTFWVELPRAEEQHPTPSEAAVPASSDGVVELQRPYVLHVEDNPSNRRLLSRVLQDRDDISLLVAETGEKGLDLARRYAPRLVLLDLHLPDLDGAEVLDQLRADPTTAAIPVVIVSADATQSHREQLLAAGAMAYLTKPYDVSELVRVIDSALVLR